MALFRVSSIAKLAVLIAIAAVIYLLGQLILSLLEANSRIDRCWDDYSPAYIQNSETRLRECHDA